MFRKRNRILKRLVLGFAVAALVVPSAAVAARGGAGQQASSVKAGDHGTVRPLPSDSAKAAVASNISIENVRLQPRSTSSEQLVKAGDYGMPRAMPTDYALSRGDAIELARTHERNVVSADIENVRLQPRTVSTPQVVAAGFDWGDAGIGAGIVFGLLLVGGAAFYGTRQLGKVQTA
jgi:hypothetical protein